MTDTTQEADNLRAKSDALLERCGYEKGNIGADGRRWWRGCDGKIGGVVRWHPYANAQDAIDLAKAMGLRVSYIKGFSDGFYEVGLRRDKYPHDIAAIAKDTIAAAICASLEEAMKQ